MSGPQRRNPGRMPPAGTCRRGSALALRHQDWRDWGAQRMPPVQKCVHLRWLCGRRRRLQRQDVLAGPLLHLGFRPPAVFA